MCSGEKRATTVRHALGHPHVAVTTQKDWVATPEFDVMSILSGNDFALLALFGVQRQDTLLGAFCSTPRGQKLHVASLLLESHAINTVSAMSPRTSVSAVSPQLRRRELPSPTR